MSSCALTVAAALLIALPARSSDDPAPPVEQAHFDPASDTWNGLAYLATTAQEAKIEVQFEAELDLGTLKHDDVLVVLEGTTPGLETMLGTFVSDGGSLVLAVEQNAPPALLATFGLSLADGPLTHDRYFRDHPRFPSFRPTTGDRGKGPGLNLAGAGRESDAPHFVWFNVEELVTNHPVGLIPLSDLPSDLTVSPVIRFAAPGAPESAPSFLVEVKRDRGQALVVGDASIFINDMQRNAYGDKQFVANAMRYFCGSGVCRVRLLTSSTQLSGRYEPHHGRRLFGLEGFVEHGLDVIELLMDEANGSLSRPNVQVGVALATLLVIALASLGLPWPGRSRVPAWQRAPAPVLSPARLWADALTAARGTANFRDPALLVGQGLTAALERRFGPRPPSGLPRGAAELPEQAQSALARSLVTLDRLERGGYSAHLPATDFEVLWNDVQAALSALGR
ncbi:MAG: hypothetical protein IV100_14805 [Myxococcales bacterium]|nr:hypothetical protein [Myxococcales bacterium]